MKWVGFSGCWDSLRAKEACAMPALLVLVCAICSGWAMASGELAAAVLCFVGELASIEATRLMYALVAEQLPDVIEELECVADCFRRRKR